MYGGLSSEMGFVHRRGLRFFLFFTACISVWSVCSVCIVLWYVTLDGQVGDSGVDGWAFFFV